MGWREDSRLLLLEFNSAQGWHYNYLRNGKFDSVPETYGWHTVSLMKLETASAFCEYIDRKYYAGGEIVYPSHITIMEEWRAWNGNRGYV